MGKMTKGDVHKGTLKKRRWAISASLHVHRDCLLSRSYYRASQMNFSFGILWKTHFTRFSVLESIGCDLSLEGDTITRSNPKNTVKFCLRVARFLLKWKSKSSSPYGQKRVKHLGNTLARCRHLQYTRGLLRMLLDVQNTKSFLRIYITQ